MTIRRAVTWLVAVAIVAVGANSTGAKVIPRPPAPVEGKDDPVPDAPAAPLSRDQRLGLYRGELGALFQEADAERLLATHQLLEDFFHAPAPAARKEAARALKEGGEDLAIIGRLTRLRLDWPALAPRAYYVNHRKGPYDVRYFLGIPGGYDRLRAWPLVVKIAPLPPLDVQPPPDAAQVTALYNGWIADELRRHPDAVVLMPLLDLEEPSSSSPTAMNEITQPILDAADRVNIDPSRVYLMGHASGARAAWNLALHYPTYFASFISLAGSVTAEWQRERLINLRNVPPVVWADAKDTVINPELSRSVVTSMQAQKLDVEFMETRSFGHEPPDAVIDEAYRRMRGRVRPLYPSRVTIRSSNADVIFNRDDWIQIWQEADPGKESKLPMRGGLSKMTFNEKSAKVDARREGNAISLSLENVQSLRVYLNDQMVDLDQPLTITINRKKTIQGKAHRSLEELLNDQRMLGRGWRYFSAVLDIDLGDAAAPATRPATRPSGKIIYGPG